MAILLKTVVSGSLVIFSVLSNSVGKLSSICDIFGDAISDQNVKVLVDVSCDTVAGYL